MKKIPLTRNGRIKLESELKEMKGPQTRLLLEALPTAREQGDISENAEYDSAREAYEMHTDKIQKLEHKLTNSYIIDADDIKDLDKVSIFTKVKVFNHKLNKEQIFNIVSGDEVSIKEGKISFESPIGSALVNKRINDTVDVTTPAGIMKLEILDIFL